MRLIDEQFLETPWYGSRQMARHLRRQGYEVVRKRVRRLMAKMGLAAVYRRPRTTASHPEHRIWSYLLRNVVIDRANQVWCADITYTPMRRGFLYVVAVMDWATRKVPVWRLSNTMDVEFCIAALEEALAHYGRPAIFNADQGSQFTSPRFTGILTEAGVRVSVRPEPSSSQPPNCPGNGDQLTGSHVGAGHGRPHTASPTLQSS